MCAPLSAEGREEDEMNVSHTALGTQQGFSKHLSKE